MTKNKIEKVEHKCTLHDVLEIVGGKWSIPIIFTLFDGTKRFSELEREIPNINTRMLVKELKKLQQTNIITRDALPTVPPTVNYTLTHKGQMLEPILRAFLKWGEEFIDK
ncbi:winged helix-turn-helix transcriptional regulator [Myroides odoratimimus]|uniref:MarR family transcriptional regulator n=4 Tax=Myroides TaxID=76831 RepID=A0A0U3GX98_9FLAO|nr:MULTISPECIES: winged helix-turn-helix transcriptional regulator [Myroides]AJA70136.1 transcriptional regulator, HxlR family [Myroides sp. A21]AJH15064.1 MarR family transcriptional regulator [Myroides profundi]ALU27344.1 MarR family transcriptional regulator [Myroides odoratimimus]APA93396.1 MarR family transcriptional regulator [Myroides sp. ZB35]EHO09264.1 hypothetical protein HMPREF9714_01942 [Myroides odoratimimus CCUG 12901]